MRKTLIALAVIAPLALASGAATAQTSTVDGAGTGALTGALVAGPVGAVVGGVVGGAIGASGEPRRYRVYRPRRAAYHRHRGYRRSGRPARTFRPLG